MLYPYWYYLLIRNFIFSLNRSVEFSGCFKHWQLSVFFPWLFTDVIFYTS